ncbi:hypothetical protein F383_30977 [Gossypium arboreum]|uniref:Secreted protein n=1 Tax=Gossypium arboreum TaxID=29729 RepID=A0A0B0MXY2_GOSAR|nr:hypothetical protein F383_37025 [Gossypium arboreum]KHG05645.1 hypothetical protein F383_30977 [Gossypium arboreum]
MKIIFLLFFLFGYKDLKNQCILVTNAIYTCILHTQMPHIHRNTHTKIEVIENNRFLKVIFRLKSQRRSFFFGLIFCFFFVFYSKA